MILPKETPDQKKERAEKIIATLSKDNKHPHVALDYTSPFELLIATILAAQFRDVRVNMITPGLFKKYPTPKHFANASLPELETDLQEVNFFRSKAKYIQEACKILVDKYNGEVPRTMEELVALPGVGRKTANCVLGNVYDIPGIVCDTHVIRISNLLGIGTGTDAVKLEYQLMDVIPKKDWVRFGHLIATHGRTVCIARRPQCSKCSIATLCPSAIP